MASFFGFGAPKSPQTANPSVSQTPSAVASVLPPTISTVQQLLDIRVTCKATHESLYELTVPPGHTVAQLTAAIEGHEDAEPTHRVLRGLYKRPSASAAANPSDDDNLLEHPEALLTAVGIRDGAELLADYPGTEAEAIAFLKGSVDALRGEGATLRGRVATMEGTVLSQEALVLQLMGTASEQAVSQAKLQKQVEMLMQLFNDSMDEGQRAKGEVDALRADLSRASSRLAALESERWTTQNAISNLRTEVNAVSERQANYDDDSDGHSGPLDDDEEKMLAVVLKDVSDYISADQVMDECRRTTLCNPRRGEEHTDADGTRVIVIVCNTVNQRNRMINKSYLLEMYVGSFDIVAYEDYFD